MLSGLSRGPALTREDQSLLPLRWTPSQDKLGGKLPVDGDATHAEARLRCADYAADD